MDEQNTPAAEQTIAGIERRQFERKVVRTPALMAMPGQRPVEILTLDISVGGLGILCPTNPSPGTPCKIRMNLPVSLSERQLIDFEGKVTHSVFVSKQGSFKIGVQFVDLPADKRARIQRFVTS
jgi:c-di-GMP-binding flagellar brake protein YcgR